jgi:hypothetical protein
VKLIPDVLSFYGEHMTSGLLFHQTFASFVFDPLHDVTSVRAVIVREEFEFAANIPLSIPTTFAAHRASLSKTV